MKIIKVIVDELPHCCMNCTFLTSFVKKDFLDRKISIPTCQFNFRESVEKYLEHGRPRHCPLEVRDNGQDNEIVEFRFQLGTDGMLTLINNEDESEEE